MAVHDLYKSVTDQIIKDLESGCPSWTKPWRTGNPGKVLPENAATGRHYSGINIPILWQAREANGYPTPEWLTYKQCLPMGWQVRKGEKATTVVFVKKVSVKKEDEETQLSLLRVYHVFNVAQIDGFEPPELPPKEPHHALDFIQATKAEIQEGGDKAAYVPSLDRIYMPPEHAFTGREHYFATTLHECVHWSGHKNRLNRDLSGRFGTHSYAAEELVAELGAAFLCAHLGIKGQLQHSEYISNWVQLLKSDSRAIFTASSKASQAADYLRSFSETVEE